MNVERFLVACASVLQFGEPPAYGTFVGRGCFWDCLICYLYDKVSERMNTLFVGICGGNGDAAKRPISFGE